ncbi:MAG: DUF951 family protein [Chloroflexota bacterium]|nr:DUF951 family protein [Chloroflexota bacterium]
MRDLSRPTEPVGSAVMDVRLGDRLELRKPHACGGREWRVVRLGADIGLTCQTCARRVLLERAELERRFRRWIVRGEPT